jgi:hypothetical protein
MRPPRSQGAVFTRISLLGFQTGAYLHPAASGGDVLFRPWARANLEVETGRGANYQGRGLEARTSGAGRASKSANHLEQAEPHHTSAGG